MFFYDDFSYFYLFIAFIMSLLGEWNKMVKKNFYILFTTLQFSRQKPLVPDNVHLHLYFVMDDLCSQLQWLYFPLRPL